MKTYEGIGKFSVLVSVASLCLVAFSAQARMSDTIACSWTSNSLVVGTLLSAKPDLGRPSGGSGSACGTGIAGVAGSTLVADVDCNAELEACLERCKPEADGYDYCIKVCTMDDGSCKDQQSQSN
jgi:hypothetical protein